MADGKIQRLDVTVYDSRVLMTNDVLREKNKSIQKISRIYLGFESKTF